MKSNQYVGQFLETLDELDRTGGKYIPGLIMSSPGLGKTTTIEKWCELKGYNVHTLIASNFSSDDILGIQSTEDGRLERLPPSWYNELMAKASNGKRNVLFLDELTASDPYIQAPLFNLIFKHDLVGRKLPDNTLIVAAGNYSSELGNAFNMTAPMTSRFMILNITNDDIDLMEVLDDDRDIEDIHDPDELKEFLGLDEPKVKRYDPDRFVQWVRDNRTEFKMGKSEFIDDIDEGGLLGFITVRTFGFCVKFAKTYMQKYNGDVWTRIVGDTLGVSNKRERMPIREVLRCNINQFLRNVADSRTDSLSGLVDLVVNPDGTLNKTYMDKMKEVIDGSTLSNTTEQDITKFSAFYVRFHNNKEVARMNSVLSSRLRDVV